MKNLALGIYEYDITCGAHAFGWRLVELLPFCDKYAKDVQRTKQLATQCGFRSRTAAVEGFACMAESLRGGVLDYPVVDVPHYGWAPRVVKSDD